MIVVESCAAIGRGLIGAGQCVDTLVILEHLVGWYTLDDHDAALDAAEGLGVDGYLAAFIADANLVTGSDAKP